MYFERDLKKQLTAWKRSARKPLVIHGIRQVGKTSLVKKWGTEKFGDLVYLDMNDSKVKEIFSKFSEPEIVIKKISNLVERQLDRNETLIILDNIDESIQCLEYLPYFNQLKEKYYIIAISSYFDFLTSDFSESFHKEVLKKTLYPISYREYINSVSQFGKAAYSHYVGQDYIKPIKPKFYDLLEQYYQAYLISGGLPEPASTYYRTKSTIKTEMIKSKIRNIIQSDFLKHHNGILPKRINDIWTVISNSEKFKAFNFSEIGKHSRIREYNHSIDFLLKSGLICKVKGEHSNAYVLADIGLYYQGFERANLICKSKQLLNTIIQLIHNCERVNYVKGVFHLSNRGKEYTVYSFTDKKKMLKIDNDSSELLISLGNFNLSIEDDLLKLPPFFVSDIFKFYAIAQKEIIHEIQQQKKAYDFY